MLVKWHEKLLSLVISWPGVVVRTRLKKLKQAGLQGTTTMTHRGVSIEHCVMRNVVPKHAWASRRSLKCCNARILEWYRNTRVLA